MAYFPDHIVAVLWFASTLLLGAVGWSIAGRLFPGDETLNRVAHTIVICWAHIVVVGTTLGATGLLLPPILLAGVTGSAVLSFVLVVRLVRRLAREAGVDPIAVQSDPYSRASRFWCAVWAVVFAFWIGHVVTGGLLRFPTDWDTLMYHLPLVDHWLQVGSLYAPDDLRWSDPGNNELITVWLVAPFSGDFLYGLTNLPACVLLACTCVEFGRQIGLSTTWRNLTGLAVAANFVVFKQLTDVENDAAVAALFLASLVSAMRYARDARTSNLILGIVSLGLLAGVKYYALGYAAVAAATAALLIAYLRGARATVVAAILGLLGILIFSGYWYVRNWVFGGSPLHPLALTAANAGMIESYPGGIWSTTFLGNGRKEIPELAIKAIWAMMGPCYVAALLGLPLTLIWLALSGFKRTKLSDTKREGATRLALAFATVASGLVLLVTPFAVEDSPGTLNQMHWKYCPIRYGMCFLSLSMLAFAVTLHDISHVLRCWWARQGRWFLVIQPLLHIPEILLIVGIAFQLVALRNNQLDVAFRDSLLIAANMLLVYAIIYYTGANWPQLQPLFVLVLGVLVSCGVAWGGESLASRWHGGFAAHYDKMLSNGMFSHFERTQHAGSNFCVLDLRPYPFFGSARQFRVCQPHRAGSAQELEDYLRTREVAIVAARFDMNLRARGWSKCRQWLEDNPQHVVPVRERRWPYSVYRITYPKL